MEIEEALVAKVRRFLLESGTGFVFFGSQYPLEVAGEEYRIDLLFYHPKLRHYVVVELKDGGFKPEYAGKMMTRCCHPDEEIEAELGMRVVDSISNNSRAGVSVSLARSENCDLHGD